MNSRLSLAGSACGGRGSSGSSPRPYGPAGRRSGWAPPPRSWTRTRTESPCVSATAPRAATSWWSPPTASVPPPGPRSASRTGPNRPAWPSGALRGQGRAGGAGGDGVDNVGVGRGQQVRPGEVAGTVVDEHVDAVRVFRDAGSEVANRGGVGQGR
ncbi:hypothetical protein STPH1_6992 [Streptomyces sp. OM5714]|nr:hypothetical protein STPH1_6992 [Streptomyces sp. OM5714]